MTDAELSGAVLAYVWGASRRPWPGRDTQAVRELYGERSDGLLLRINTIFAMIDAAPIEWATEDLHQAAARIEQLVGQSHPELDTEALSAVTAQFAYSWR